MLNISDLIRVADAYMAAVGLGSEKTLSHRVFGDSKRLTALRGDAEITVGRFNGAMAWFAANWPDGADRPDVLKPYLSDSNHGEAA